MWLEKRKNFYFDTEVHKKIDWAFLPQKIYIPFSQDNSQTNLLVQVGESVREGQMLMIQSEDGSPVHSPIPGVVKEITTCTLPLGGESNCVIIELSGQFNITLPYKDSESWKNSSSSKLIDDIKRRGIVNTFVSPFYALGNVLHDLNGNGKVLGVRLFDFDPSCAVDSFIAKNYLNEVLEGSAIIARAGNFKSIVYFYDPKVLKISKTMPLQITAFDGDFVFLPTDSRLYPEGSALFLNKLLKNNAITKNIDLYVDSTTAFNVYKGISLGRTLTEIFVEVYGSALHENHLFIVKLGTPISSLLKECGGTEKMPAKIIINGLVKGKALSDIHAPITKDIKSIAVLTRNDLPDQKISACVHCGLCRNACPLGLHPDKIYEHYIFGANVSPVILRSASICDSCALCNASCPARLPLFQTISSSREIINEK